MRAMGITAPDRVLKDLLKRAGGQVEGAVELFFSGGVLQWGHQWGPSELLLRLFQLQEPDSPVAAGPAQCCHALNGRFMPAAHNENRGNRHFVMPCICIHRRP